MAKPTDHSWAEVLVGIAHGDSVDAILADVCRRFEETVHGTVAGVTILDRTAQVFHHAVFPSLSDEYGEALRGIAVADKPGTCALAVFEGRTVECSDVHTDERFSSAWRKLSLQHGMRAIISIPTMNRDGLALGTFVVSFDPDAPLSPHYREFAAKSATLCGLVLAYRRNQLKHELLVGELQHRIRNLFSSISAVVHATLKAHPEPELFRESFDGRLTALARVHRQVLETKETDMRELLTDTLAPYSADHDVTLEGPALLLTEETTVAFSLSLHELATNAAKFGALSIHGGSLRVCWGFESEEKDRFVFTWREVGGPPVSPPRREGYGHRLLHRSIASAIDGRVDLDYRTEGLVCTVTAPHSARLSVRVL